MNLLAVGLAVSGTMLWYFAVGDMVDVSHKENIGLSNLKNSQAAITFSIEYQSSMNLKLIRAYRSSLHFK